MRANAKWILAVLVVGLVAGCGKSAPPETDVDAEGEWEVRVESPLDTLVVPPDDIGAAPPDTTGYTPPDPAAVAAATAVAAAGDSTAPAQPEVPDPRDFTPGWRVQVFASSNLQLADEEAERLRGEVEVPVYVEFEPPFYKVRAGNFLVKQDAEEFRDAVKRRGWDSAWVTETLVRLPGR
jgi:cell division septation protein DedD